MNKAQEMETFLEYFPTHFSIFEKDNDIELNSGNTIIDKDTLIIGFKEPGKKKIEFLCKHIINNFRVFKGNDFTTSSFIKENDIESILTNFKEYLKTNKKRKSKKTENNENGSNNNEDVTEKQKETVNNSQESSSKNEKLEKDHLYSTKTDQNNNINWSFDWKITIDNKSFIQGNIKNINDLNNLMEQMKNFFTNNSNESEKSVTENNQINQTKNDKIQLIKENTVSFDKEFSLELTEDDLNDLFN